MTDRLRVGFDATSTIGDRTGVGVFAHEVLARLATDDRLKMTAFAVTWRGRDQLRDAVPAGVRVVTRPMAARPLRLAWARWDRPTLRAWIGPQDVLHGPNFVVPPGGDAAEVVTVHDLTPIRFPELCTPDTLTYPTLVRRAIARGAWIHTPSQFVADEVIEHFTIDPERVVAVANGVTPLHAPTIASDAAAGIRLVGAKRYVLAIGTVEPRKNLAALVMAFDRMAAHDPDLHLVIAGPDGWGVEVLDHAIAHAAHRDRIRRMGWVSDVERAALLRGATVLAYPSRYEGFGLPPLEAMDAGIPVVTTDAGAIPETVGDAAVVVPNGADDIDALSDALKHVIGDASLRRRLIAAGLARTRRFTWDATALGIADLYLRAAHRS